MSTRRSGSEPPATNAPPEDQAHVAEPAAEQDEAAADLAAGRIVSAERYEEEMRRFLLELRRESRRAAGRLTRR